MSIYRLEPIDSHSLRWKSSSIRRTLWANADNPQKARELAALKTSLPMVRPRGTSRLTSPWLDHGIASCALDPTKLNVPEGTVVDGGGRDISAIL